MSYSSDLIVSPPLELLKPLSVPKKLLMGAGPGNAYSRVLETGYFPLLGHLNPEYLQILSEVKAGIRYAFQTKNRYTFCMSGTGHLAMEASLCNVLEKGETVLILVCGFWGGRVTDMAERCGAVVHQLIAKPGTVPTHQAIEEALKKHRPTALFLLHGESSVGVRFPIDGVGALCRKYNTIFIVDAMATVGGVPVFMDNFARAHEIGEFGRLLQHYRNVILEATRKGIDVMYSGAQKCLSSIPGTSLISFSDKAIEKIKNRKTKVQSYNIDALLLGNYWGCDDEPPRYHHSSPIKQIYAMREALAILAEVTLEETWKRHEETAKLLYKGLNELGLKLLVQNENIRLSTNITVVIPENINGQSLSDYCMKKFSIEISGSLYPDKVNVWRIGLQGSNCQPKNVDLVIRAFKEALQEPSVNSSLKSET